MAHPVFSFINVFKIYNNIYQQQKGAENHSRLERVQHLNTLYSKQQEKGAFLKSVAFCKLTFLFHGYGVRSNVRLSKMQK